MKHLGKKSLSAVLSTVVTLLWWTEWIAGATGIIMVGLTAHYRRGFALQVPLNFSTISIAQVYTIQKSDFSILNTTSGTLSIHIGATWQNISMMLAGYGLLLAAIIIVTYQLKKIFASFRQNQPFQKSNMQRIRNISLVLMSYSVVQWVFTIVVNRILLSQFIFRHLDLSYDFNVSCFLIGIALLATEGIFKTGLLLEEERQLTI